LLIARRRMRSLKSHCFLHTADVPHSPGLATFSFVGLQFPDSRIASVRIVTGNEGHQGAQAQAGRRRHGRFHLRRAPDHPV